MDILEARPQPTITKCFSDLTKGYVYLVTDTNDLICRTGDKELIIISGDTDQPIIALDDIGDYAESIDLPVSELTFTNICLERITYTLD